MAKILVVDDTNTDLQTATLSLRSAGYNVSTARNEQEAKQHLATETPDLIVLDVVLPDRSGFELCRELKEHAQMKCIPVVMCSSKNSKMDIYWGMQQGADAYLAKPVDTDQLVATVGKFLS
jgi:two-component system, chemotaxis family, response regulator PixH